MNEDHLERLILVDQSAEEELESLALAGMNSGDPLPVGPDYWEEKHRRLEERLLNIPKSP
jgi:hypothetical protein